MDPAPVPVVSRECGDGSVVLSVACGRAVAGVNGVLVNVSRPSSRYYHDGSLLLKDAFGEWPL